MYPNTKHLPSTSVYVPGPLLFLFLHSLPLLFLWLSPVPWFPLRLFSKYCSSCSVTVCVPILFVPLISITYQLLAATVLCSYFRSPSSSCPADYMLLLPVFCVFGICKPLQFVTLYPVHTPVISSTELFLSG